MRHNLREEDTIFYPDITFGDFLRKKRILLNLTQKDLADKIGVKQSTISMWELGVTSPSVDDATYIVKRMGGELRITNIEER